MYVSLYAIHLKLIYEYINYINKTDKRATPEYICYRTTTNTSKKIKYNLPKRSKMLAKGVFLPYLRMRKIHTPAWLLCSSSGDRKSSSLHPGDQGSPQAKLYLESSVWSPLPSKHFCCWSPAVLWFISLHQDWSELQPAPTL